MNDEKREPETPAPRDRRAYVPPAIEETTVFETLALQCARTAGIPTCEYSLGSS